PAVIRKRCDRQLSAGGELCRSYPERREARRSAGPGAGQVRARHQPPDCQDAWHHRAWQTARCPRPGDRMSICVVGSGGSWLPCSTIAEHSVEGCDHFSHDGDDDDLGFFVGGGEAFVEGFEGGTVTACAEGGHVEDVTDRHPTTIDAAV